MDLLSVGEGPAMSVDAPKAAATLTKIVVRPAEWADLKAALSAGWRDFLSAPLYGLFFGGIFAFGGLVVVGLMFSQGYGYLAYPLATGFALIGPFVAVGLYEVSRRREAGAPLDWYGIVSVICAQGRREIGWMAFITLFIMLMWMYQVRVLLAIFLGSQSFVTVEQFLNVLITTEDGLMFLAVGHVFGAIDALVLFSLTVVSFPLLLDQERDFITAMITSVRAVMLSPPVMVVWAGIIVVLLVLAMVPAFTGLLVVLPILGHTTWHLYRRLVSYETPG
jgi:uncharacterized membrane protein